MNNQSNKNDDATNKPTELNDGVELCKKIEVDTLKENTILALRVRNGEALLNMVLFLNERYGKIFKEKNITILALGDGDKIEELDENEMKKFGWTRQASSRIITLT